MTPTSPSLSRLPDDRPADRRGPVTAGPVDAARHGPPSPAEPTREALDELSGEGDAGDDLPDPPLTATVERLVDEPADGLLPLPIHDISDVVVVDRRTPMPSSDRTITPAQQPSAPAGPHAPSFGGGGHGEGVVCPFCAHVRPADTASGPCPRCTMQDTASTRRSTGERIGPWFVLQRKNPTAPGLRFSVLLTLARRGHVTPRSIVRGPTTGQLWRYAAQVKGLSRIFGLCWHCAASVSPDATTCPRCRSAQEIPDDPDVFLESYATLPVMRETPGNALGEPSGAMQLPGPTPAAEPIEPEPTPTFGSRRITHPMTTPPPPAAPRRGGPNARQERRIVPPAPTPARSNLPARRPPQSVLAADGMGEGGAPIMSASELAAVFQIDATQRPGAVRRLGRFAWRAMRVAAVCAVVVGVGGIAVAYFRPDWAEQARTYAEPRAHEVWAKAQQLWNKARTPLDAKPIDAAAPAATPLDGRGQPPATPIEFATTPDARDVAAAAAIKDAASRRETTAIDPTRNGSASTRPNNPFPRGGVNALPAASVSPQLDGLGGAASTFTPASKPVVISAHPLAANPPSTRPAETPGTPANEIVRNTAAPTPAPAAQGSQQSLPPSREMATGPTPPPPTPVRREPTLDEAITQAGALRNDALDAESRRDWKAAVMIYEQIMRLPEAAWPGDVKPRLEIARQNLAK